MTAPHTQSQPDIAGYREAEGHASSLLQQAIWIEDSVDGTVEPSQRLDLGDVDTDELRSAAQYIMQQEARVEELTKALEKYGCHEPDCETETWHGKGPLRCSCGFYEATEVPLEQSGSGK